MVTFRHENISACVFLGTMDISAPGTLRHCTGTFRHKDILEQRHLCRNVCAKMSRLLCTVPKCTCAKTSMCRNILMPKFPSAVTSMCQKSMVLKYTMPKCSCAEMSLYRKVRAEMSLAEMSGAEIGPSQIDEISKLYSLKNISLYVDILWKFCLLNSIIRQNFATKIAIQCFYP